MEKPVKWGQHRKAYKPEVFNVTEYKRPNGFDETPGSAYMKKSVHRLEVMMDAAPGTVKAGDAMLFLLTHPNLMVERQQKALLGMLGGLKIHDGLGVK